MATNNQRLTAYITPENWTQLQEYAAQHGFYDNDGKINQSPLVNTILNSFFTGDTLDNTPVVKSDTASITPVISSDVLEDVKAELRDQIIGEVNSLMTNYQEEISKKLTA
jgi:hypothetical protein